MDTQQQVFQPLDLANIDWPETVKLQSLVTDYPSGTFGILGKEKLDPDTLRELVVVTQAHHRKIVNQYMEIGTMVGLVLGACSILALSGQVAYCLGLCVGLSVYHYFKKKM
jgi:hypothetical protein